METGLTLNQIIAELAKSPHGNLATYVPVAKRAIAEQGDFFAHLVAWNQRKGEIRDAKVALPVLALNDTDSARVDNALANLAMLDPRNLVRAVEFARGVEVTKDENKRIVRTKTKPKISASRDKKLTAMVRRYLEYRERNFSKWERNALQHRESMKALYVLSRYKPSKAIYGEILFDRQYPAGSVFDVVSRLKSMDALEIAGTITAQRIPFLVAMGALGAKQRDPDVLMALIKAMSASELVTNAKRFEKAGVKTNPALRAALDEALAKASKSSKNILKTTVAAEAIEDEDLREKLQSLQKKQISNQAGIEGDWLVLGDKSGSMSGAIEVARRVAATLATFVKGRVQLTFFDTMPKSHDVTGMAYEQIMNISKGVVAGGGTSIGCGLQQALDSKLSFGGIAIVSDGGENHTPHFPEVYKLYCQKMDVEPSVYLYHVKGEEDVLTNNLERNKIASQKFELGGSVDYYALPNLVQSMRTNRYSLVQEIFDTPLLTLDAVLSGKEKVHA